MDEDLAVIMKLRTQSITWSQLQLKPVFADGLGRLVNCYKICVEKRGHYF
jgi:hypothetical protein